MKVFMYVTILGKGSNYRNVPLMSRTVHHLKAYMKGFHPAQKLEMPLFYTTTHGIQHSLSNNTIQNLLKNMQNRADAVL